MNHKSNHLSTSGHLNITWHFCDPSIVVYIGWYNPIKINLCFLPRIFTFTTNSKKIWVQKRPPPSRALPAPGLPQEQYLIFKWPYLPFCVSRFDTSEKVFLSRVLHPGRVHPQHQPRHQWHKDPHLVSVLAK